MGSKKIFGPVPLFAASAMTGTTTLTSQVIDVSNEDNLSMYIAWTGNAVGTLSVLVSDNKTSDFVPLSDITPALVQPNNNAQSYYVLFSLCPFFFIKLQYVNTSGTGALTARISGKDIN